MPVEIEIKFRIPDKHTADKLLTDKTVLITQMEPFSEVSMSSSYFDTPTHELNKRQWALRMRRENEDSVVTLKTKQESVQVGGLFVREEWQCRGDDLQEGILQLVSMGAPAELASMAKESVFVERCQVVFARRKTSLQLGEGAIAEMAIDRGEILADGKREALLELELELLLGNPAPLISLAAQWEDEYGLVREVASKYERALRLIRRRASR